MNSKRRLSFKIALVIFFAISMVCVNVGRVWANTELGCTEEGKPYIRLHGWLTNETVKVIGDGEVIGEFTTDGDGYGEFILDQPGSYDISIQNSSETEIIPLGSITCEPSSPPLSYIVITPPSASLNPGDTEQFSAKGYSADGSEVPIQPTWTATNGDIKTDGAYTAPEKAGEDSVTAKDGDVSASAPVTISYKPLSYIVITPPSASLNPGDTEQFSAKGYSADGSEVPIDPTWSSTGGEITPGGKSTAPKKPGEYTVTASVGDVKGTALVQVNSSTKIAGWVWAIGIVALGGLGFAGWYFLVRRPKVAG